MSEMPLPTGKSLSSEASHQTDATGRPAETTPPGGIPSAEAGSLPTTECWSDAAGGGISQDLPEVPGHEVLGLLGRGGMGVVLKARHKVLDRIVAIKMPLLGHLAEPTDRQRFLREARATARLRHPNICPVFEVGEAGDRPYTTMAYIEGQTLTQWAKQREPTAREAAEMVAAVAHAVSYAHTQGLLHRDIKPGNVMVDATSGQPVLMDFGLAKELACPSSELTHTGQVMGTPAYMAPEQASGHQDRIGTHSDVYALGAILYYLLCGRSPFTGNPGEVIRQVQVDEPIPPRKLAPRTHRDLETVCLKAMAKEPRHRYSSALELAQDLERFCAGESILARREGVAHKVWRKVRRRPIAAALMLVLTVAAIASGYFALRTRQIAELERTIDGGQQAAEWTPARVTDLEAAIDRLRLLAPGRIDELRGRVHQRFAAAIEASIQQPRLQASDVTHIEADLELLAARDVDLAEALRAKLRTRLVAWQPLMELQFPFAEWESVFDPTVVDSLDQGLVSGGGTVFSRTACRGRVRLEAEFDQSWTSASRLGLLLGADSRTENKDRGYAFLLEVPAIGRDRSTKEAAETFESVQKRRGKVRAVILQNEVPLREDYIPVPQGPLRLVASRDADRLSFQINDRQPLAFWHAFPVIDHDDRVFALEWPRGVPLTRLRASEQPLTPAASLLERGDSLYAQGEFFDALAEYQKQAIESGTSEFGQEARLKQALCLIAQKQPAEARKLLEEVAGQSGTRWPLVARCHLWAMHLREGALDEAYAVFEGLSWQHTREELQLLIPVELSNLILGQYRMGGVDWFVYRPNRLRDLTRCDTVQEFFGATGPGGDWSDHDLTRLYLCRAYELEGDRKRAIALAETLFGEHPSLTDDTGFRWFQICETYTWLLRLNGENHRALKELDLRLYARPGVYREQHVPLLVERARIHVALDQWEEADEDLAEFFRLKPLESRNYHIHHAAACLLRGFSYERRGDLAASRQAWREGAPGEHSAYDWSEIYTMEGLAMALVLASLAEEFSAQGVDSIMERAIRRASGQINPSLVKGLLNTFMSDLTPETIASIMRQAFARPHGRVVARQIALRQLPPDDLIRSSAGAILVAAVDQMLANGRLSPEQEALVVRLADDLYAAYYAGELTRWHVLPLAFTWKGLSNSMGWAGVAPSLEPALRGPLAYLFGLRFLRLNHPAAAEQLFQSAVNDAQPGSPLELVAQAELNLLGNKP
jgi:tetratricopeptide (TPR) repeat protein/predicted Ser/Thr protein kinase